MKINFQNVCDTRLKRLKNLQQNPKFELDETIEDTIEALTFILKILTIKNPEKNNEKLEYRLKWEAAFLKEYKEALRFIEPFSKEDPIILGEEPKEVKISNEDRDILIYDFFKNSLDLEMFEIFEYIFKQRQRFFHYHKKNTDQANRTVYLPYYNESHIFLNKYGFVEEFTTICHEIAHAIVNYINPYYNDSYLLAEIPSELFEVLSLDYLKAFPEFNLQATDKMQYDYCDYLEDAKTILIRDSLYKACDLSKKVNLNSLKRTLNRMKNKAKYAEQGLFDYDTLSSFDVSKYLNYSFAQVYEQIMFLIYHIDPERCIDILSQILTLSYNTPFKESIDFLQKLGLDPTENTAKKYKSLILNRESTNFKREVIYYGQNL